MSEVALLEAKVDGVVATSNATISSSGSSNEGEDNIVACPLIALLCGAKLDLGDYLQCL